MPIDFINEIKYELFKFKYLMRKEKLKRKEIEEMIILINHIQELIEYYLYEIYDYLDY